MNKIHVVTFVVAMALSLPAGRYTARAAEAFQDVLAGGSTSVVAVCERVIPPGTGNDTQSRVLLSGLAFHVARPGAEAERKLLSDGLVQALNTATNSDVQAFFLEQLQWCAGPETVAPIAGHLDTPALCAPTVVVLQRVGGRDAESAMAAALKKATAKTALTLIHALGESRYADAVADITRWASSPKATIRETAEFALANIGAAESGALLTASMGKAAAGYARSMAASRLLLWAQRRAEAGDRKSSDDVCRRVLAAPTESIPGSARCSALTLMADAGGAAAVPTLLAALPAGEPAVVRVAADRLAGVPGAAVTQHVLDALGRAPAGPQRRVLIEVLGNRGDPAALAALGKALKDSDEETRIAALSASARIGGARAAQSILAALQGASEREADAIVEAVAGMGGEDVNAAVAQALPATPGAAKAYVIRILARRKAHEQADAVLALVREKDATIRNAAMAAMAELGAEKHLASLIGILVAPPDGADEKAARTTVLAVARRVPDEGRRTRPFRDALAKASPDQQVALLKAMPELGGAAACATVVATLKKSPEASVQEAAIRALAAWPDDAAIKPLFEITGTLTDERQQILAVRGLARLAGQPGIADTEKLAFCRQLLQLAKRSEEKTLVLGAVASVRSRDAIRLAAEAMKNPATRQAAALTVARIAVPEKGKKSVATREDVEVLSEAAAVLGKGSWHDGLRRVLRGFPDPNHPNVALGRPVATSCPHQGGHSAEHAVDGSVDLNTGWWGVRYPSWLRVDLEKMVAIDAVKVFFYWGEARFYQYTVDVSVDGKQWKSVADMSRTTAPESAEGHLHRFDPVKARYVRLNVLKNSVNEAVHVLELEVYATGKGPSESATKKST